MEPVTLRTFGSHALKSGQFLGRIARINPSATVDISTPTVTTDGGD